MNDCSIERHVNPNPQTHIHEVQNKVSKNLGVLYKAKFLLNQKCLKDIYFSFIHCHLNYANIAWASTNPNKLKKLNSQQKHAARIICNEERYTHAKPLMKKLNILNVCLSIKYYSDSHIYAKSKIKFST